MTRAKAKFGARIVTMVLMVAMVLAIVGAAEPLHSPQPQSVASPDYWVPFSAQLKVVSPDGAEVPGRFFRDQHGCERHEAPEEPKQSTVTIHNVEKKVFYRQLGTLWIAEAMESDLDRRVPRKGFSSLTKLPDHYEGFETYEQRVPSRRPDGTRFVRQVVVPELNFYAIQTEIPPGRTIQAHDIRLGPHDHSIFEPPRDALKLVAVDLRVTFSGGASRQMAANETALDLKTPDGKILFVAAYLVEPTLDRIRVVAHRDATGGPGPTVVDEVSVPLGGTAHTTRLEENFEVSVTRIISREVHVTTASGR